MRDIVYVSDFFYPEVKGGAERWDKVLIDNLEEEDVIANKVHSNQLKVGHLRRDPDALFVVSNFAKMSDENRDVLENADCDYVIVEHDYKLEEMRQPQRHPDYDIPAECMRNISFYQHAKKILVQSELQQEIFKKNIPNINTYNLSGNLWKEEELNFLSNLAPGEGAAIVESGNVIKGTELCEKYCRKNDIEYDLISAEDTYDFWRLLSDYEKLVYLPLTPETCGRVAVEARMIGLNVIGNKKVGAMHEPWFERKSPEIIEAMRSKLDEVKSILNDV